MGTISEIEGDIFYFAKRGHFYFAATAIVWSCLECDCLE